MMERRVKGEASDDGRGRKGMKQVAITLLFIFEVGEAEQKFKALEVKVEAR